MAVIDWLKQRVDLNVRVTGSNEAQMNCPFCTDTRRRFYVSLNNKHLCHCFNCGASLNFPQLVAHIEGVTLYRAKTIAKEIASFDDDKKLPSDRDIYLEQSRQDVYDAYFTSPSDYRSYWPLPGENTGEFIPLTTDLYSVPPYYRVTMHDALMHLVGRGIPPSVGMSCGMGICVGNDKFHNRLIIPVRDLQGRNQFYVGRAIYESNRKELSPAIVPFRYTKSQVCFNLEQAAHNFGEIVLSEGIYDALSWGGMGVSLLGKVLYKRQLESIVAIRNKIQRVYVALDADALDYAYTAADRLSMYFDTRIVRFTSQEDDPNNTLLTCGSDYLWQKLEEAEPYDWTVAANRKLLSAFCSE